MPDASYPRDLVGYGRTPPHAQWPGEARASPCSSSSITRKAARARCCTAIRRSEQFLSEIIGAEAYRARHLSMESIYEYGSRAGVWRLLREFERRRLPLTVFGVAMALERNPDVTAAFVEHGHEIACHGWRWIHYQNVDEATEREHMRIGVASLRRATGAAPVGWYTGRDSPNTRRLVVEHGGFLYDSDYYGDDLPFWTEVTTADGAHACAPRRPLRARHQRHAVRHTSGLQHRRAVLHLSARRVRRPLRRRRGAAEDAVHRHALPASGAARRASPGSAVFSITSNGTTGFGCADAWTSRGTGSRGIPILLAGARS